MKNQNEKTEAKTEVKPVKKERAKRKFFLYAEGKGLIAMSNADSTPTFNDGELVWFNTKSKALFAKDFFLKIKLAETIDILTKVA